MQLKVKVTLIGQGHMHFTNEQGPFIASIVCTMSAWAYFTAYDKRHVVSYRGKGYKAFKTKSDEMSIYFTGLFIIVIIFYIYWFVHTLWIAAHIESCMLAW